MWRRSVRQNGERLSEMIYDGGTQHSEKYARCLPLLKQLAAVSSNSTEKVFLLVNCHLYATPPVQTRIAGDSL